MEDLTELRSVATLQKPAEIAGLMEAFLRGQHLTQ